MANADQYMTQADQVLAVNASAGVLANDANPTGQALTAVLVTGPSKGSLTLNPDGSFTYVPNENFTGTDTFTYEDAIGGDADANAL